MHRVLAVLSLLSVVAACGDVTISTGTPAAPSPVSATGGGVPASYDTVLRRFVAVAERVEPVAEAECRKRIGAGACDFQIIVDDRPGQPPNAYFTQSRDGRPLMIFTLSLLQEVQNSDEIAFIMGHEASHHIAGHIPRGRQNAAVGAVLLSGIVAGLGGSSDAVRVAQDLGADIGFRSYSKDFELEADRLGTVIAARAGFDPVRGAAYFTRIPDPGDRFLGSHPPNADRIRVVQETAAGL